MPIPHPAAKPGAPLSFRSPAIAPSTTPLLRSEQRPDILELVFSSSGRLSRAPFLAGMAWVLATLWLYDRWVAGPLRLATGWAVLGSLLFSGCCLVSRRLHDLGRAGWWTGLFLALFLLAWPHIAGPVGGGSAVLLIAAAVWLCGTPGEAKANRFGPPYPRDLRRQ